MARPQKDGVDYFPLDVRMDDKFELIEAEFGLIGFAVVLKLYQSVYEVGYYREWAEEAALLFGKRIGLPVETLRSILDSALRRGIFDQGLFDRFRILTSVGIQRRYLEAVKRRKTVNLEKRFLLVDLALNPIDAYINWVNVSINPVNDDGGTQSILKEIKGKERKGNTPRDKRAGSSTQRAEFVNMSDDEYGKLVAEFGDAVTKAAIDRLDNYKGSSGKKYKNDYRAILSWVIRDLQKDQPKLFAGGKGNERPDVDYGTSIDDHGVERTRGGMRVANPDKF